MGDGWYQCKRRARFLFLATLRNDMLEENTGDWDMMIRGDKDEALGKS